MNLFRTIASGVSALVFSSVVLAGSYATELPGPHIVVGGVTTKTIAEQISSILKVRSELESVVTSKPTRDAAEFFCSDEPGSPDILLSVLPIVGTKDQVCIANNVGKVYEGRLGYFTSVLVQNSTDPDIALSSKDIYRALAQNVPSTDGVGFMENGAKNWSDVNPDLPKLPIFMVLPRPVDGSREIFDDEALIAGCRSEQVIKLIVNSESRELRCRTLNMNKVFETSSEEERVEKLKSMPAGSVALVSILTYEKHRTELRALQFNGAMPTPLAINAEDYTLVLPLLIYFKASSLDGTDKAKVEKVRAWVAQALAEDTTGDEGLLARDGIMTSPASFREGQRHSLSN